MLRGNHYTRPFPSALFRLPFPVNKSGSRRRAPALSRNLSRSDLSLKLFLLFFAISLRADRSLVAHRSSNDPRFGSMLLSLNIYTLISSARTLESLISRQSELVNLRLAESLSNAAAILNYVVATPCIVIADSKRCPGNVRGIY